MAKFFLSILICAAIIVGGAAVYLVTGESIEKTLLTLPAFLSIFYFLYAEAQEEELVVAEQWAPISAPR